MKILSAKASFLYVQDAKNNARSISTWIGKLWHVPHSQLIWSFIAVIAARQFQSYEQLPIGFGGATVANKNDSDADGIVDNVDPLIFSGGAGLGEDFDQD